MPLPRKYESLFLTFYPERRRKPDGRVEIGNDEVSELVMDEKGTIRSFDQSGILPTRYVSSSEEQLAQLIRLHQTISDPDELRRQMERVDRDALSDPKSWWSLVLDGRDDEAV